jgi:hypothetical protein
MIFHFARPTSLRKILLIKARVLRPDRSAFDIIYTWELDVIRTHGLDRKLDLTIELAPAEAGKIALTCGSPDLMLSGCGEIELRAAAI